MTKNIFVLQISCFNYSHLQCSLRHRSTKQILFVKNSNENQFQQCFQFNDRKKTLFLRSSNVTREQNDQILIEFKRFFLVCLHAAESCFKQIDSIYILNEGKEKEKQESFSKRFDIRDRKIADTRFEKSFLLA